MNRTPPGISDALAAFRSHRPVAMPTETVYGLAAPVSDLEAVKSVFKLKERPLFDPLIVHVSSLSMARRYARTWPAACDLLGQSFWPGPLTMILPKSDEVDDLITAGHGTVGLRVPKHPLALELIQARGEGLAAPSANPFGATSPSCAEHVRRQFGDAVPILDGGKCAVGIESTVCEVVEEKREILIYRPGLLGERQMADTLTVHGLNDYTIRRTKGPPSASPGQLSSHYRPQKPLLVYESGVTKEEALAAGRERWGQVNYFTHSLPPDPYVAARTLYSTLQAPKAEDSDAILLYLPVDSMNDQWVAIRDRLTKAASLYLSRP